MSRGEKKPSRFGLLTFLLSAPRGQADLKCLG
jgi:hypothetical protein